MVVEMCFFQEPVVCVSRDTAGFLLSFLEHWGSFYERIILVVEPISAKVLNRQIWRVETLGQSTRFPLV